MQPDTAHLTASGKTVLLGRTVQATARKEGMIDMLRFLLYPKGLADHHTQAIRQDDEGVLWL